ncbi:MAG: alginate export family protein [Firmicutes bacterium]|nr:alginate export family protein [Bacillota bacterium]
MDVPTGRFLVSLGKTLLATVVSLMGFPLGAAPGSPAPQQPSASSAAASSPRIAVGVELRLRDELRDNADFRSAEDFEHFLGYRLRLDLKFRLLEQLELFVQPQDVWLVDADTDKVVHDLNTNLHQAWLAWRPGGSGRWELQVGRQEFIYGEERLIGAFGWDNVGRAFDGARLRRRSGAWTNDLFWARQVQVRRGGARSRDGHLDLSGAYLTRVAADSPRRWEVYGLFLRDGLRTRGELLRQPGSTRLFTAGVRLVHRPPTGWRYSVENAWQLGERGPDAHRAAMLIVTAGHTWDVRGKPRWQLEYAFATGDNQPADGRAHEFHNLFPTNHLWYGYADLVGLRNLHALRGTLALTPHAKLTAELDLHAFWLAAARGPWKDAAGRVLGFDPTGRSGNEIGQELDLTLRLPLSRHLHLLGGYSVFFPGTFARNTRGSALHHFGYLQTTLRF